MGFLEALELMKKGKVCKANFGDNLTCLYKINNEKLLFYIDNEWRETFITVRVALDATWSEEK